MRKCTKCGRWRDQDEGLCVCERASGCASVNGSTARRKVRILQIGDWSNYRMTNAEPPIGKDIKRSRWPERLKAYARENGWEVVP